MMNSCSAMIAFTTSPIEITPTGTHVEHVGAHDLPHGRILGGFALQDDLPGVVPLREDTDQPFAFDHEEGPDVLVGHHLQGLEDGDVGGHGENLLPLRSQELRDRLHDLASLFTRATSSR